MRPSPARDLSLMPNGITFAPLALIGALINGLDIRFRPKSAMNCIHAGTAHGKDASYMVLTH